MMYLCDRLKHCRFSVSCGRDCKLTCDKAHELVLKSGSTVECKNLKERTEYEEVFRECNIAYMREGMNLITI